MKICLDKHPAKKPEETKNSNLRSKQNQGPRFIQGEMKVNQSYQEDYG
jgi:hypothetical protein